MKKVLFVVMSIILILALTACDNNKEATHVGVNAEILEVSTHVGVNAEILEVSTHVKGIVVKGLDVNSILGEKCYINCESSDVYFIYANNSSGKTTELQFEDFVVGDTITVDVKSVENKYALTSRVQLLTQRK